MKLGRVDPYGSMRGVDAGVDIGSMRGVVVKGVAGRHSIPHYSELHSMYRRSDEKVLQV